MNVSHYPLFLSNRYAISKAKNIMNLESIDIFLLSDYIYVLSMYTQCTLLGLFHLDPAGRDRKK